MHPIEITYSYIAGMLDADGSFSIKKSTYQQRNEKAKNPQYSEKVALKQVSPQIPKLLRLTFKGGALYRVKGSTPNSKPLWCYDAANKIAVDLCTKVIPYLRVKTERAKLLLKLRKTTEKQYKQHGYWYQKNHSNWQNKELITTSQAARLLDITQSNISRAIRANTLLGLSYDYSGKVKSRIPLSLVEILVKEKQKFGSLSCYPSELIEWKESIFQQIREMNKLGINGTSSYHKTGIFKPKEVIE